MSVGATGLLDQRATLFAYTVDTDPIGVPVERFTEWGSRWCRLEPPTGRELTLGQRETHRVEGVLVFRADIPIDAKWLARVGGNVYRILAVLPRRMQGLQHVLVAFADDDGATLVES